MRFIMMVKADKKSEAGELPSGKDLEVMGKYNEELVKAGILRDATGLQPSSKGARVSWPGGQPVVTDGPFTETKEIIAGYWIIEVASRDEAIAWAKRIPFHKLPTSGRVPEVEIRQFFELSDFPEVPPAVAELERRFEAERGKKE